MSCAYYHGASCTATAGTGICSRIVICRCAVCSDDSAVTHNGVSMNDHNSATICSGRGGGSSQVYRSAAAATHINSCVQCGITGNRESRPAAWPEETAGIGSHLLVPYTSGAVVGTASSTREVAVATAATGHIRTLTLHEVRIKRLAKGSPDAKTFTFVPCDR